MSANSVDYAADESKAAAKTASDGATKLSSEAQRSFADAAKRIEKAVTEGIEQLRAQTRAYSDTAGQQIDQAQQYMTERVRERPLAATGAALGVGVLIGLLLASASSRR
ncbi:MAG: glycine zipper domain-containing protein [Phenylobacterium sp.]